MIQQLTLKISLRRLLNIMWTGVGVFCACQAILLVNASDFVAL